MSSNFFLQRHGLQTTQNQPINQTRKIEPGKAFVELELTAQTGSQSATKGASTLDLNALALDTNALTFEIRIEPTVAYHQGKSYVGTFDDLREVDFVANQEYKINILGYNQDRRVILSSEDCNLTENFFLDSGLNRLEVEVCVPGQLTLNPMSLSEN